MIAKLHNFAVEAFFNGIIIKLRNVSSLNVSNSYWGPVLSALSKSVIRSFTSSIPTDMRIRSSVRPRASRIAAGMLAWDIKQGKLIRDFTLPARREGTIILLKLQMTKANNFLYIINISLVRIFKVVSQNPLKQPCRMTIPNHSTKWIINSSDSKWKRMITKTDSDAEILGSFNNMLGECQWSRQKAQYRSCTLCLKTRKKFHG